MLEIHKRDIKDVFPPSRIFNANLAPFFNASGSAGYWGDYKFWEPSIGFSVMIVDENHVFNKDGYPFVVTCGPGAIGRELPESVKKVFQAKVRQFYRRKDNGTAYTSKDFDRARRAIIRAFAALFEYEITHPEKERK